MLEPHPIRRRRIPFNIEGSKMRLECWYRTLRVGHQAIQRGCGLFA